MSNACRAVVLVGSAACRSAFGPPGLACNRASLLFGVWPGPFGAGWGAFLGPCCPLAGAAFAGLLQGKDFGHFGASVLFGQNLFLVIPWLFVVALGVPRGLWGCPLGSPEGSWVPLVLFLGWLRQLGLDTKLLSTYLTWVVRRRASIFTTHAWKVCGEFRVERCSLAGTQGLVQSADIDGHLCCCHGLEKVCICCYCFCNCF